MPAPNSLQAAAVAISALVRKGLEALLPPQGKVLGRLSWADLATAGFLVLTFLGLHGIAAAYLHRKKRVARKVEGSQPWRLAAFQAVGHPLFLLIWVVAFYLAVAPLMLKLPSGHATSVALAIFGKLFDVGVFIVVLWLCVRLTRVIDLALEKWAMHSQNIMEELFVPLLGRGLRAMVPVAGILLALPLLDLPAGYHDFIAKATSLLIIGTVAWFLFRSTASGRDLVLSKYDISQADNLRARTVYTQVRVIARTIFVGLGVLTFGSALMVFSEVRHVGASILASAGILGVIGGLAAQSTLSNLFAGFQLALAQPIRLDDVVIVEGSWGRIEEINLTYVVVHVWDDTRLVVPLSYFISKPFQNWTRSSSQIMGQVHLWVDYTLPVDELRAVVERIVKACPQWDGRFWNLQVVEASEHSMQLRILATAADSSKAWDLRCKIREDALAFIQRNYAGSLPRTRAELDGLPQANPTSGDGMPIRPESAAPRRSEA